MILRFFKDEKPFGFVRVLSWAMLIVIIISSLLMSTFIADQARKTLIEKQKNFALLLAENLNHQIFRRFTLPTIIGYGRIALRNPTQYQRLEQVVQNTIHGLHVKGLRIYDNKQITSYSTNKDDLGKTSIAGIAAQKAVEQNTYTFEIESKISPIKALFLPNLPDDTFTLRTTYPLRLEGKLGEEPKELPIMGVLEITQDITQDYMSVLSFQRLIFISIFCSSMFMFMILVFIIKRAERVLTNRLEEKEKLEHDLHQNEKLAGMGRMVSSIAHEIRNPLGIISSSAEMMIKRDSTDDFTKKMLTVIFEESKRLAQTVTDFLDYAKPKPTRHDKVDLALIINQALGFLENELESKGITVARDYNLKFFIEGDSDLLYRAVYNVVSNSIQAMDGDGEIRICGTQGKTAILQFHDSGSGFDEAHLSKMLDPFFTTRDNGTGLGLPIVNSIVKSHHGTLTLGKSPLGGALVTMEFPLKTPGR